MAGGRAQQTCAGVPFELLSAVIPEEGPGWAAITNESQEERR